MNTDYKESVNYDFDELPLAIMLAEDKKADLLIKAKTLGIKANTNMKKEVIANKIADSILQNPTNFFDKIPVEDVLILQEMIHDEMHEYPISPRLLTNNSLMEFGIVDMTIPWIDMDEKESMFIYKDIVQAFEPVIDEYVASTECIERRQREEIILGILNLYGIVEISELERLYLKYRPHCTKLVETICSSYLFTCNSRMDKSNNKPVFISPFLFDYPYTDMCIKQHHQEKSAIFTEEAVKAAGSCAFPLPLIKQTEALKKLLVKTGSTEQESNELVSNIWILSNNEQNPGDIIFKALNSSTKKIPSTNLSKQLEVYSEVINHLPTWSLKGQAPEDIACQEVTLPEMPAFSKETGRNDTCPCGSGKKYKKCCGNN